MNMDQISPLVVTPHPLPGESVYGYLLRTVDLNGYASVSEILRYAGMTEQELRSAHIPLDKLAAIIGCTPDTLRPLSYYRTGSNRNKGFGVLGHDLYTTQVRTKDTKFCPDCVQESGRITVFWNLSYAVACPIHGRKPLTVCPGCGKTLSWNRPGLLMCSCDYDLSKAPVDSAYDSRVLALMDVVRRKLFRLSMDSELIHAHGLPVVSLDVMSLRTLLALIDRLGKAADTTSEPNGLVDVEYRRASVAAAALSGWPKGFYAFLAGIEESAPERVRMDYYGLRKQFELFYTAVFKSNMPKSEIEFMHEAFVQFGQSEWKKATVDKRLRRYTSDDAVTSIGLAEAAKKIGVTPGKMRRLVQAKIIRPTVIENGKTRRYVFDANLLLPKVALQGKSYSLRVAAKLVGIPPSVLQACRDLGIYTTEYIGSRVSAFHEYDVQYFKDSILRPAKKQSWSEQDGPTITLGEVLKRKLRSAARKASILQAIAHGQLTVFGGKREHLVDVVLSRDEVDRFLDERISEGRDALTAFEAARLLKCDPLVIPWLVEQGYLTRHGADSPPKVTAESVSAFGDRYVSCADAAKQAGCASSTLVNRLRQRGYSVIQAERGGSRSVQAFALRDDINTLREVEAA